MKVQYTETKTVNVTKDVPDYFAYDDSKRGYVVDILLSAGRRTDIFSDEMNIVEGAIFDLTEAYKKATDIVALFDCGGGT